MIHSTQHLISFYQKVVDFLNCKTENDLDSEETRNLKGLIRRSESYASTRYLGLEDEFVHFLDLPFYETGSIKKNNLSEKDISIMANLIEEVKPHQIYAAGDLADPHGTHKVCLDALIEALKKTIDGVVRGAISFSDVKIISPIQKK